jgi:hypothetical protein
MEKTLKDLGQRLGKPAPEGDMLKSFNMEDDAEFVVEISSGWIQSFTHKRLTGTEGFTQENVISATRKELTPK